MSSNDLLDPEFDQSGQGNNQVLPNATATLVLGILSIVGCLFYGVPGLVCGIIAIVLYRKDKQIYLANPARYAMSYKNSNAGYICGVIGLCLSIAFIIFVIVYVFFILSIIPRIR